MQYKASPQLAQFSVLKYQLGLFCLHLGKMLFNYFPSSSIRFIARPIKVNLQPSALSRCSKFGERDIIRFISTGHDVSDIVCLRLLRLSVSLTLEMISTVTKIAL